MNETKRITRLLDDWRSGDREALNKIVPLIYNELRRIARRHLKREYARRTFNTTVLVNEAYLKMVDQEHTNWQNRAQFFGIAAQLMRRILVDKTRERSVRKRDSDIHKVRLAPEHDVPEQRTPDLQQLDEALVDLESIDPMQCRLVEMRYFAGLTLNEIADVLDISLARAKREWQMIRAWLYQHLQAA